MQDWQNKKMKPTNEQQLVEQASRRGESFKIEARAGSGKTTTLKMMITPLLQQGERILYLTYNNSIAREAKSKLPRHRNLTIKTIHALAYHYTGAKYKHKFGEITLRSIKECFDLNDWSVVKYIKITIESFINSDASYILPTHIPQDLSVYSEKHSVILELTHRLWQLMIDESSSIPMSHEGYLKLFTLNCGNILSNNYSCIMVDEGQDQGLNVISTLKDYKNQLILVGDSCQQLYGYRNAKNALKQFTPPTFYLTKSFRFGPNLANAATAILLEKGLKKQEATIVGNDQIDTRILKPYTKLNEPRTIITRTVNGALATALKLYQAGASFCLNGGIETYISNEIGYVETLSKGLQTGIPDNFLKSFPNFQSIIEYVDKTQDIDMDRLLQMVASVDSVSTVIEKIKKHENGKAPYFIITTAHRSKGLEYPNVVLSNDFPSVSKLNSPKLPAEKRSEELNILYTAMTRAVHNLVLNDTAYEIIMATNRKSHT